MDEKNTQQWLEEFNRFIYFWEQESELLKEKQIDLTECDEISDVFHKNSDGLLLRRPADIAEDDVFQRLETMCGKLNSVLAMACSSEIKTVKKE